MIARKSHTQQKSGSYLVDRLAGVWIGLMGLVCLIAMSADIGLVSIRTDSAQSVLKILYIIVLVGCIAGAALRLTQRLHIGRDGS